MIRTLCRHAAAILTLGATLLVDPRLPWSEAGEPPAPPGCAPAAAAEPPPPPVYPAHRIQIGVPENNPLELYPPADPRGAMPLVLALHGKDMDPADMCEAWSGEGRAASWLLCPAGNAPGGESFDWGGSAEDRLAALDAQIAAVESVYGPLVDHDRGDVLVGFSRGAFLARDLVYARPGRFRAMVLLGAAVRLDPDRLRAAGVKRVLLAAGELDDARSTMEHTATFLSSRGVKARFVSLGPIYHRLPDNLGRVMGDALRWAREPERGPRPLPQ
jgi:predicted esterase